MSMPNSPSRIGGDYEPGVSEEVKYVDPGDFGSVRAKGRMSLRIYVGMLILVAIAVALGIAYWVGA